MTIVEAGLSDLKGLFHIFDGEWNSKRGKDIGYVSLILLTTYGLNGEVMLMERNTHASELLYF